MLLAIFVMPGIVSAQIIDVSKIKYLNSALRDKKEDYNYESIKGNPYMEKEFKKGLISYAKEEKKIRASLRYNMLSDRFEMEIWDDVYLLKTNKNIEYINYLNKVFKYKEYINKDGQTKKGYVIQLVEGEYPLFKKMKTVYREAEPPETGYDSYKPPRFERLDDLYLMELKDEVFEIESFRKRKFLKLYFKDKKSEYLDYMKENNINLRREDEMIQFFKYINN